MRGKSILRAAASGFVAGAVLLGGAWAGIGLAPPGEGLDEPGVGTPGTRASLPNVDLVISGERLDDGQFLVGADRVSLAPNPDRWTPDDPPGTCPGDPPDDGCLITFDGRWAKRVLEPDEGVWARSLAISNGQDTVILVVLDLIGWFYAYPDDVCGDCGARDIRAAVGSELGVPPENLVIASTHTHASADTLADIPSWYYEQVRDVIKDAMRNAYASMVPSVIDIGSAPARFVNSDRRVVSRAVPDYEVQWLRATDADGASVATMYNFAVHPTVLSSNDTLHAGLNGPASARLEEELGGVAMFFPSGLGDQTVVRSRGREGLGHALADVVLRDMDESPRRLQSNVITSAVEEAIVPGDNAVLLAARAARIFVRDIEPPSGGGPMAGRWGKDRTRPTCAGAGALSLATTIGGLRVGEAAIMTAPGEIFASISLVTKHYLEGAEVVFVLGLANDQLGYIIPANQFDRTAQQGLGLAANSLGTSEYEEVLSVHECMGELVMDELIAAGGRLGFRL